MRIMIAILGVALLTLPGTCTLMLASGNPFDRHLIGVWAITFLISAPGLVLLYVAIWGKWNGGNR